MAILLASACTVAQPIAPGVPAAPVPGSQPAAPAWQGDELGLVTPTRPLGPDQIQVLGAAGTPLAGARVRVLAEEVFTDADGIATLPHDVWKADGKVLASIVAEDHVKRANFVRMGRAVRLPARDRAITRIMASTGGTAASSDGKTVAVFPPGALDRDAAVRVTRVYDESRRPDGLLPYGAPPAEAASFLTSAGGYTFAVDLGGARLKPGTRPMVRFYAEPALVEWVRSGQATSVKDFFAQDGQGRYYFEMPMVADPLVEPSGASTKARYWLQGSDCPGPLQTVECVGWHRRGDGCPPPRRYGLKGHVKDDPMVDPTDVYLPASYGNGLVEHHFGPGERIRECDPADIRRPQGIYEERDFMNHNHYIHYMGGVAVVTHDGEVRGEGDQLGTCRYYKPSLYDINKIYVDTKTRLEDGTLRMIYCESIKQPSVPPEPPPPPLPPPLPPPPPPAPAYIPNCSDPGDPGCGHWWEQDQRTYTSGCVTAKVVFNSDDDRLAGKPVVGASVTFGHEYWDRHGGKFYDTTDGAGIATGKGKAGAGGAASVSLTSQPWTWGSSDSYGIPGSVSLFVTKKRPRVSIQFAITGLPFTPPFKLATKTGLAGEVFSLTSLANPTIRPGPSNLDAQFSPFSVNGNWQPGAADWLDYDSPTINVAWNATANLPVAAWFSKQVVANLLYASDDQNGDIPSDQRPASTWNGKPASNCKVTFSHVVSASANKPAGRDQLSFSGVGPETRAWGISGAFGSLSAERSNDGVTLRGGASYSVDGGTRRVPLDARLPTMRLEVTGDACEQGDFGGMKIHYKLDGVAKTMTVRLPQVAALRTDMIRVPIEEQPNEPRMHTWQITKIEALDQAMAPLPVTYIAIMDDATLSADEWPAVNQLHRGAATKVHPMIRATIVGQK